MREVLLIYSSKKTNSHQIPYSLILSVQAHIVMDYERELPVCQGIAHTMRNEMSPCLNYMMNWHFCLSNGPRLSQANCHINYTLASSLPSSLLTNNYERFSSKLSWYLILMGIQRNLMVKILIFWYVVLTRDCIPQEFLWLKFNHLVQHIFKTKAPLMISTYIWSVRHWVPGYSE